MTFLFAIVLSSTSSLILFWAFSNVVSTMPSPSEAKTAWKLGDGSALLYKWAYDLLHLAAGNGARIFPQLRFLNGNSNPDGGK